MNFLFDIGHPAHVHLFKNLIRRMKSDGHKVIVTSKDEKIINYLLNAYNIEYINLGKKGNGILQKLIKQTIFDLKVLFYLYKYNIDKAIGTSVSITHACLLHSAKSYVFNEDNVKSAPLFANLAYPFADYIITPASLYEDYGKKHIKINSLHELAYLHPNNFISDESIFDELDVTKGQPYFILRFNAFKAHHDEGVRGLSTEDKRGLINLLKDHGKVFITFEGKIEDEFKDYQIAIKPERMHHALYYAKMFIGDSNTMAIEAAVLGTPSIRCNDFVGKCPVIEEIEKNYGLTYGFKPESRGAMFKKLSLILSERSYDWEIKKKIFLKDKIDFSEWMIRYFGEN